jgi:hypothetical protein
MPISLGTRSRDNIQYGPVEIYIAEGGTIAAPADFGTDKTVSEMATLLSSFTRVGELLENPTITSDPVSNRIVDPDNPEVIPEVQHQSEVTATLVVVEMDNDILNALIARAEAGSKTDFLWLRQNTAGEVADYLRNVPFLVALRKDHSFSEVKKMEITVNALTDKLKTVTGQFKIV